jgi:hypothetical protein
MPAPSPVRITEATGRQGQPEDDRRFAERLLAVVPDAQAAARASKNFLARAARFLREEAGIGQVQCRDSGRSSRARLCGPRAEADTAMDPSLWCDVTKEPLPQLRPGIA